MIDTLCRLLDAGVTQFHVVKECEAMLQDHGYMELDMGERWELTAGGRYYVKPYSSMMVAFAAGEMPEYGRLNIGLAHTDFPMLKIKTQPDMNRSGEASWPLPGQGACDGSPDKASCIYLSRPPCCRFRSRHPQV